MGRTDWVARARGYLACGSAAIAVGLATLAWPASADAALLDLRPYLDAAGGVVRVPAGTYDGTTTTKQRSERLTLVADGRVVINGTLWLDHASNLTLQGSFLVRGAVQVRGAKDITLDGIEVTNPGLTNGTGIVVNRARGKTEPAERIRISNVYIHDTYDDAVRIGTANDVLVEGVVAERIFDVPGDSCAGEKCHDDAVQVMGPSHRIVIRNNDLEANVIFKTDYGDIDAELSGNRIHDDHNAGLHVHEMAGTDLRLTIRSVNYIWNHPAGTMRIQGSPTIIGQELIVAAPPPGTPSPNPPAPAPTPDPDPAPDPAPVAPSPAPANPSPAPGNAPTPAAPSTGDAPSNPWSAGGSEGPTRLPGLPPLTSVPGASANAAPSPMSATYELGPDDPVPSTPALIAALIIAFDMFLLRKLLRVATTAEPAVQPSPLSHDPYMELLVTADF